MGSLQWRCWCWWIRLHNGIWWIFNGRSVWIASFFSSTTGFPHLNFSLLIDLPKKRPAAGNMVISRSRKYRLNRNQWWQRAIAMKRERNLQDGEIWRKLHLPDQFLPLPFSISVGTKLWHYFLAPSKKTLCLLYFLFFWLSNVYFNLSVIFVVNNYKRESLVKKKIIRERGNIILVWENVFPKTMNKIFLLSFFNIIFFLFRKIRMCLVEYCLILVQMKTENKLREVNRLLIFFSVF